MYSIDRLLILFLQLEWILLLSSSIYITLLFAIILLPENSEKYLWNQYDFVKIK